MKKRVVGIHVAPMKGKKLIVTTLKEKKKKIRFPYREYLILGKKPRNFREKFGQSCFPIDEKRAGTLIQLEE